MALVFFGAATPPSLSRARASGYGAAMHSVRTEGAAAAPDGSSSAARPVVLPAAGWDALSRGARGRCPRCNQAKLFARFLKPILHCPYCGQDWTLQQADDFPAYVSILLTGHIMAPVIIALVGDTKLSTAAAAAIIFPMMIILMIALLQPAKGAIIALQWWLGMHGFAKERRSGGDVERE